MSQGVHVGLALIMQHATGSLQHNGHLRDKDCHFGHLLTLFLTTQNGLSRLTCWVHQTRPTRPPHTYESSISNDLSYRHTRSKNGCSWGTNSSDLLGCSHSI